jgi:hypothetical protein
LTSFPICGILIYNIRITGSRGDKKPDEVLKGGDMRIKRSLFTFLLSTLALLTLVSSASAWPAADYSNYWTSYAVSIVWPHDGQGNPTVVAQSRAVNVSVWPIESELCDVPPTNEMVLWCGKDNEPLEPVKSYDVMILRNADGYKFPTLEYNNVPANLAADPTAKYRFVENLSSNVWVHAADPRTFYPHPVVPTGYSDSHPEELDTRIQIVWPHDGRGNFTPVERATHVNIAVDIFEHGTLKSVRPDLPYGPIALEVAEGNGKLQMYPPPTIHSDAPLRPEQISYTVNGQDFPRWVFNNVTVKPGTQHHFRVIVMGGPNRVYPTIWTHAADARTIFPNPQPPPYGCTSF